jgi:putative MFS transporter
MWMIGLSFIFYVQADEWGLDAASIGMYDSLGFLGQMLGSYFWSSIADRYGRMKSFKTQIFVLFFGAVGVTFSYSLAMIVSFAFVMNFGIGGELALGGIVYKEFIPASYGSTICVLVIGFISGNLLTDLLAMVACVNQFPLFAGWRWMFIVLLVVEVGFIAVRLNLPETPFYLASKGRMVEVEAVLNLVRPSQISMTNTGKPLEESILIVNEDFCVIDTPLEPEIQGFLFLKLFSLELLRPTLALGSFCFMNNIAFIGFLMFMPQILTQVGSEGQTCESSYLISAAQQVTCIPACLIAWKLLDTSLGRRWSIVGFTVASGVFMILLLLVQNFGQVKPMQLMVVSSLCIALSYMGISGIYTMIPEAYPTQIRSTGSGWVTINILLSSIVGPFITGLLMDTAGVTTLVIVFAALMTGSGIIGLALKETRGSKTM